MHGSVDPQVYSLFGVQIGVPCRLPALTPTSLPAEVHLKVDRLPSPAGPGPNAGLAYEPVDGGLLFGLGARALVRHGREITVDPDPALERPDAIAHQLHACMAVLLQQRGLLVLHASAVLSAAGVVLIAGRSGAGKSTLVSALHAAGHTLVADDVAVIGRGAGGHPVVLPGPPTLKLCHDAAAHLHPPEPDGPGAPDATHAGSDGAAGPERKLLVRVDRAVTPSPTPPVALLVLDTHDADTLAWTPVAGHERFKALLDQSYGPAPPEHRPALFGLCAELAQTLVFEHLRRPAGRWSIDELAAAITRRWSVPR